eukprot:2325569-Amphidinium_carterae.1
MQSCLFLSTSNGVRPVLGFQRCHFPSYRVRIHDRDNSNHTSKSSYECGVIAETFGAVDSVFFQDISRNTP